MSTIMSIKEAPPQVKREILHLLGYDELGGFVIDSSKAKVKDRYTKKAVKFSNMVIFPGSTIILDDNPFSINSYLEEFGDDVLREDNL